MSQGAGVQELLAEAYRAWLTSSEAASAFWTYVSGQTATVQQIVSGLGQFGSGDSVVIVPVLGPVQEQASDSVSDLASTRVSDLRGRVILMFSLGSSQQVRVTAEFRDRRGNPAAVDGVPEWMTDNSEVLNLVPVADGRSCLIKAVGPLGTARVTLTADADTGAGTTPVVGTLEVTVTAGSATVITLQPGEPEEQPEPPPSTDTGTTGGTP